MQITVNFYKLLDGSHLINSIFLICNKILQIDEKTIIYLKNEEQVNYFDDKLWTASQNDFLPHLTSNSGEFEEFKDEVPILLTAEKSNLINAENIIILEPNRDFEMLKSFKKVFFLFSSENEEELLNARNFWKEISNLKADFSSKFYLQNQDKKWELQASV